MTFLTLSGQAQSVFPGLPVLTPAYTNNFSKSRDLPQPCFSDFILDKKERLWVATCPVMAGINSVRLFQFDGYNFYPANLANDQLPLRTMAILRHCTPSGELLGLFENESVNAIFLFDPARQTTRIMAFDTLQEGVVKDLVPESANRIIVLFEKPDSFALYRISSWQNKERIIGWRKINTGISIPVNSDFEESLFISGDEAFVAYNNGPGIFKVNLREHSCQVYPKASTLIPFSTSNKWRSPNDKFYHGFVPTSRGGLICFLPNAQPQVFIRPAGSNTFEPFEGLPEGYTVCRVERDSVANILFLLKDRQEQYAGLLWDAAGRWYNYTAYVTGHNVVHNVHSINFFESVFVCANDGLCYNIASRQNTIQCLLPDRSIRGMTEIEAGRFFITSENENKPSIIYDAARGIISEGPEVDALRNAFGRGTVRNFQHSKDGSIWGNCGDSLVQYFRATGASRKHLHVPEFLYQTILSDGRIAVFGRSRGLEFYDPVSGKCSGWQSKIGLSAKGPFVHNMQQTKDGFLWVLTTSGLFRLDLKSGKETVLGFNHPFQDFRFVCMAQATDGKLWLGTFLGGVHIFDPATGSVKIVNRAQGLPSNTIVQIVQDASGDVWAGTYRGLSRLSAEGVLKNNYLLGEGLCELEFNRYAALRAQDGTLLLGSLHGLDVVSPAHQINGQNQSADSPQIYLTALAVADPESGAERRHQEALDNLPLIVLPPERRYLHISFALSSYKQPDRNQFAYMLEGLDKNWTYIGDRHELTLNDMPPGRYTLVIKGCDFEGNWTVAPVRIAIRAREFFYKQPWFYLLCLLPFLAFGWIWLQRLRSEKIRLEAEVKKRTKKIQEDKALIEKQAQELRQLDEVKSRFFTNISHELRTPITLITAPVEQSLKQYARQVPAGLQKSLEWVLYNGRKLAALVEELLELSRLEAGKTELLETPTGFYPFCRQIFSAFESQVEIKRIQYTFDYAADENWRLSIDKKRVEKIITNLLSNAIKFTPPDGKVHMSVIQQTPADNLNGDETAHVMVRVEDSGRGIPPEDLPHIFERYFQTKRTDVAREGGTGIGLALARELATLMKGTLQAESQWGKGSVFTLTLPLKILPDATTSVPPVEILPDVSVQVKPDMAVPLAQNGQAAGKGHVLIVEDNPDMQALLHSILSDDYTLTMANDGQDAWEMLEAEDERVQNLSLILSDVMMPRMDGYELLEKIKSHARWQQVPVILLTARAEEQNKLQALRLGVDDYLVKPFSPPELTARLSNLIGNYRRRQSFTVKGMPDMVFDHVDSQAEIWLKNIETAAKQALDKGIQLQASYLADAGALSERQFFREIKRLTGLTPNQYILEVRLQKARHLLQHRAYHTLAEVSYAVGFDTPWYFTRVFEAHFGKHPNAYLDLPAVTE